MHISKITYKTNVQRAPFQHEHVEVTVELNASEDADEAFEYAKTCARDFLEINFDAEDVAAAEKLLAAAKKAGLR